MTATATARTFRSDPATPPGVPRYTEPATFARLPRIDQVPPADVSIVGRALRQRSVLSARRTVRPRTRARGVEVVAAVQSRLGCEPFAIQQVADAGDIAVNPFDIDEAIATIDSSITDLRRDGATVLTIGGDHTIALPILRSLPRDHGKIAVLHFDAHLDTWDTYFGAPFTHGTPFRRASEEGLIDMERSLHMGIRGPLYAQTDLEDDAVLGFQVIRVRRLRIRRCRERCRADAPAARRRPGVCLDRYRRARSSARAGHRHARRRAG